MKQEYGLLGHPLGHSFSRAFFNDKFAREGIDAEYLNFDLSDISELPQLLAEHPNLCGLNVTIPYKQAVIPYLDELSDEARAIGAVNVIKVLPPTAAVLPPTGGVRGGTPLHYGRGVGVGLPNLSLSLSRRLPLFLFSQSSGSPYLCRFHDSTGQRTRQFQRRSPLLPREEPASQSLRPRSCPPRPLLPLARQQLTYVAT